MVDVRNGASGYKPDNLPPLAFLRLQETFTEFLLTTVELDQQESSTHRLAQLSSQSNHGTLTGTEVHIYNITS